MKWHFALAYIILYINASCAGHYTPKPSGYLRIELPEAQYVAFDEQSLPYSFALSRWATVAPPADSVAGLLNISYPDWQATIYCSYNPLERNLDDYTAECRELVERTAGKAEVISEKAYEDDANRVYATLFIIKGASASPVQFIITDSATHFFRGALYYPYTPDVDSIAPVTDYLVGDVVTLIQTFRWKR